MNRSREEHKQMQSRSLWPHKGNVLKRTTLLYAPPFSALLDDYEMHYSYDYYSQTARRASRSYDDVAESGSMNFDQVRISRAIFLLTLLTYDRHELMNREKHPLTVRALNVFTISTTSETSHLSNPRMKERNILLPAHRCTKVCMEKLPTRSMPPEEAPLTTLPNQPRISQSHICGTQFVASRWL